MRTIRSSLLAVIIVVLVMMVAGCSQSADADKVKKDKASNEAAVNETGSANGDAVDEGVNNPIVTLELVSGEVMEIELYPDVAPNTVANYVNLVSNGYYDGLIFHRIIPGFMMQGGDPTGTGMGGPGYGIKGEFTSNGFTNKLLHEKGVISMARSGHPDSAGSQFFIMTADAPSLDGAYAAFGKVIKGMESLDVLGNVQTGNNDRPLEDQVIKQMTVETFGVEYGEPVKITQ